MTTAWNCIDMVWRVGNSGRRKYFQLERKGMRACVVDDASYEQRESVRVWYEEWCIQIVRRLLKSRISYQREIKRAQQITHLAAGHTKPQTAGPEISTHAPVLLRRRTPQVTFHKSKHMESSCALLSLDVQLPPKTCDFGRWARPSLDAGLG